MKFKPAVKTKRTTGKCILIEHAMTTIYEAAEGLFEYTCALRRDFHRCPEIGFKEQRTAGVVAAELEKFGLKVRQGVGGTGVVGLLEGEKSGAVVLLRADMDALPVQEENQAEYASQNSGLMHACGHDGHMAVALTVARLLAERRSQLCGTVKFVFQPAEEGLGGAERMIAEGVLTEPAPDYALALHLWNERPSGWVAAVAGALMAGADLFIIRIVGKGGHGGLPQETRDPVLAATHIVSALQTVVARNLSPMQAAVISVTQMSAGEAYNVIPSMVELKGTLRSFEPEVRAMIVERMQAIVEGVGRGLGCETEIKIKRLTPPVVNDARVAERVAQSARRVGADLQIVQDYRTMVSEDMAFMLEKVPGCYLLFGARPAGEAVYGHHHPRFDIDEGGMIPAVAVLAGAVMDLAASQTP